MYDSLASILGFPMAMHQPTIDATRLRAFPGGPGLSGLSRYFGSQALRELQELMRPAVHKIFTQPTDFAGFYEKYLSEGIVKS